MAIRFDSFAQKMNFIMVEYSTFKKCPPEPGKFVYVTLIRHPIDQLISWEVRFEGTKVNKAWQKVIRSYKNGNKRELQKFLRKRRDAKVEKHGGYLPHRVHSITNTFGATSLNSNEERFEIAMRNLLKFNYIWLYENFRKEVESTAVKYLNWKEGVSCRYYCDFGKKSKNTVLAGYWPVSRGIWPVSWGIRRI